MSYHAGGGPGIQRSSVDIAHQALPIDRAHLARYTMGDHRLEREILELFAGQAMQTLEELRQASSDRGWLMAAHALKGSGRAVGAWRVARLAEEAERLGGLSDREACDSSVGAIEAACHEARLYIGGLSDRD